MNEKLHLLTPCPWCAAGSTDIRPNGRLWSGTKWSEPISVSVQHWCEPEPGQPARMIERVGRDEESAIAAWNRRAQSEPTAPAVTVLPDGSAFATASFPLPKDHWLYAPRGEWDSARDEYAECPTPILTNAQKVAVIAAARYAIRGATMCGQEQDFDPDAMVQNLVYALCGPATGRVLPADAAPSVAPEPPAFEATPDGNIADMDSRADVLLRISGDFEDAAERAAYLATLLANLNAAHPPSHRPSSRSNRSREMSDATRLIEMLKVLKGSWIGDGIHPSIATSAIIAALEQQAAQIAALRADAERTRGLLADANETLHGNYTVLMRLILTNPPGGRYSFFSARDGSMIEATGPINQTMTVIAALDAALRNVPRT